MVVISGIVKTLKEQGWSSDSRIQKLNDNLYKIDGTTYFIGGISQKVLETIFRQVP